MDRAGLTVLDIKNLLRDPLNELYDETLDPYAALRSVYFQRQESIINDLEPGEISFHGNNSALNDFDDIE